MKYAIIVDAGSSGSRAFVYTWPEPEKYLEGMSADSVLRHALLPIETMQLWVTKVNPGISSYSKTTDRIWKDHLAPLLRHASNIVPGNQHRETPIFFLATAGLRLLPEEDQSKILSEVCSLLQRKTNFLLPECEGHVAMIDGSTEGIYGWLSLNYLIHWSLAKNWHDFSDTYGFLDMGGASTQLAFASSPDSEHKDDLHTVRIRTASGDPVEWSLFVTTWLGFGANQARARFRQDLVDELKPEEIASYEEADTPIPVIDPCLPQGASEIDDTPHGNHCVFQGSGNWKECERRVGLLLNHDAPCKDEPCLFDGVHVPDFDQLGSKFVGVSEYWYTLQDIFKHNGKFDYTTLEQQVAGLCSSEWSAIQSNVSTGQYVRADGTPLTENEIQRACFKSAWVLTILHRGFQFPLSPQNPELHHDFKDTFQSAMEIEGTEISWTLGRAVLYASSQIEPKQGSEHLPVGITDQTGHFIGDIGRYDASVVGGSPTSSSVSSSASAKSSSLAFFVWILALLCVLGALLKFTPLGQRVLKLRIAKKIRRTLRHYFPSAEQRFEEQTASSIGYGHSYPHAGVPLADLRYHSPEAISTSRPSVRAPSRVGSRQNLNRNET